VRPSSAAKRKRTAALDMLSLLREVYLASLRDGSARERAINEKFGLISTRPALSSATAKGFLKASGDVLQLTPKGRRRLKVVMMGGAFEIIHPGHITALSEARALGNTLVVVVATDDNVERNKGRPPVTNQALRVGLVSSLRQVDLALPGNKGSIYEILVKIRPDIVALGYDQGHSGERIEREAAVRGVQLRTARMGTTIPGIKTSKILMSL